MRHSIDTYIYTQHAISLQKERSLNGKKSGNLHVGRKTKRIEYVSKLLKVIYEVVCVFANHVGLCMECKIKESF